MDWKLLIPMIFVLAGVLSLVTLPKDSPITVEEALENSDSLQGENITVIGKATKGTIACTQMFCGENNSCCNTCSGSVNLGENSSITLQGEEIGCSGKSCNITCTPETGQKYIMTGKIEKNYGQTSLKVEDYRRKE